MRMFGHGPGPIGIDLSGRAIKAVQMSGRPDAWKVTASAEVPRRAEAETGAEASRLAGVLDRQGFRGRAIALAAPDSALLTAVLDLPPKSSGAPIGRIALAEMAHIHRREPGTLELACWELPAPPRGGEHTQAMAVACPHAAANSLLDAFEGAGFEVVALDARAVAVARACRRLWADAPAMTAVLDVGWDSTLLAVVHAGVVVYERSLEACELKRLHGAMVGREGVPAGLADHLISGEGAAGGGEEETNTVAQRLIDQYIHTMGEQLQLSMSYIAHRYPGQAVGAVLLAGEGGPMPGLAERLSAGVEAPARVVCSGDLASIGGVSGGGASGGPGRGGSALVGAIGLAAGAMEGGR